MVYRRLTNGLPSPFSPPLAGRLNYASGTALADLSMVAGEVPKSDSQDAGTPDHRHLWTGRESRKLAFVYGATPDGRNFVGRAGGGRFLQVGGRNADQAPGLISS